MAGSLDAALAALPLLPRDDDGPVFAEPWQAQVFAIVVQLTERGELSWQDWAACLGAQFKQAEQHGDVRTGETYYHHWLNALEGLLIEREFTRPADLAAERETIRADDHHRRDGQQHSH
jgi:nitrile hydratase accessory protein